MSQIDSEIGQILTKCVKNPLKFVKSFYPWGSGELSGAGSDGPRVWQKDVLFEIGEKLKNIETRYQPICIAVASGHGIGKSALIGQIVHWGMSTCEDCKVIVTANTEAQLRTKTWPEISKWFNLGINKHWFKPTATAITSVEKDHERIWRADAISWSENNTEAFAGLHNKGKRIILIFDEGSAIADKVWEVAEGALTDVNTEIIWIAFGNPTRNTGRFKECFGKLKHRWITKQIDSRSVEGTNKEQIQKWIDDYGEDSDFARVRVKGQFPRAGTNQFIDNDSVANCRHYKSEGHETQALVFGIDIARFGDDQNAVCIRQGRYVHPLIKWRGIDTMQTAGKIVELFQEYKPDMMFIDGGGVGGGVIDRVKQLVSNQKVREINFGSSPKDCAKYFNKRAEMWGDARDAIKAGIQLPDDNELTDELCAVEYGFSNKQQIQLEKKEDMKKRGLSSPDCADAFVLTFADNVLKDRPKPIIQKRYYGQQSNSWMGS
jgi:hypothetical protein